MSPKIGVETAEKDLPKASMRWFSQEGVAFTKRGCICHISNWMTCKILWPMPKPMMSVSSALMWDSETSYGPALSIRKDEVKVQRAPSTQKRSRRRFHRCYPPKQTQVETPSSERPECSLFSFQNILSPLIMVAVILKFKADDMDEPIKSQLLAFLDQLPARPQTAFASRNATRCFSFAHLKISTNSGRSQQSTIRNKCLMGLGVMVVPLWECVVDHWKSQSSRMLMMFQLEGKGVATDCLNGHVFSHIFSGSQWSCVKEEEERESVIIFCILLHPSAGLTCFLTFMKQKLMKMWIGELLAHTRILVIYWLYSINYLYFQREKTFHSSEDVSAGYRMHRMVRTCIRRWWACMFSVH